jgi:hypothetical protein
MVSLCDLVRSIETGHFRNIFTAHFLPRDENITLSGGMDCQIRMCNIERKSSQEVRWRRFLISHWRVRRRCR